MRLINLILIERNKSGIDLWSWFGKLFVEWIFYTEKSGELTAGIWLVLGCILPSQEQCMRCNTYVHSTLHFNGGSGSRTQSPRAHTCPRLCTKKPLALASGISKLPAPKNRNLQLQQNRLSKYQKVKKYRFQTNFFQTFSCTNLKFIFQIINFQTFLI